MLDKGSGTVALAAAAAVLLGQTLESDDVRGLGIFLSLVGHNLQVISAEQTAASLEGLLAEQQSSTGVLPEMP